MGQRHKGNEAARVCARLDPGLAEAERQCCVTVSHPLQNPRQHRNTSTVPSHQLWDSEDGIGDSPLCTACLPDSLVLCTPRPSRIGSFHTLKHNARRSGSGVLTNQA
jgi:hypothetical protein